MFFVLSLFATYLFLLGCAVVPPRRGAGRASAQIALALTVGLLINYTLTLAGLPLGAVVASGASLALFGLVRLWTLLRHERRPHGAPRPAVLLSAFGLAYVLALYYFQILSEPIFRWDARSVWFFHSKMIWAAGAFRVGAGWTHPSVTFSSPDYPNLVPALGAQLAHAMGHWNEFLPKGALWLVLVPIALWIVSFGRATAAFLLLLTLYLFSLNAWLWNGYMDAYLTMYSGLALLLFGRFAEERLEADLYGGFCALGIAAGLKNEGLMFAVCTIAAVLVAGRWLPAFGPRALLARLRTDRVLAAILAASIAPTVLWLALKKAWGLQNHIIGVGGSAERLWARLVDGTTTPYVFHFLTRRASVFWILAALIAAAAVLSRIRRIRLHPGAAPAALGTLLYFFGLFVVYLLTPAEVTWHLLTSATRVMATVSFGLLISLFFLMSGLEWGQPADRGSAAGAPQSARSEIESAARPSGTS